MHVYWIYMIWFGWVLWHINHCRLFNVKSSLCMYIEYIWFCLVGFYGIPTIVGYLKSNPLYTYISNIRIWFCLVGFYGISTFVGYLILNLLYHSKTDAEFMQNALKAVWSIPYISVTFFPRLKQNFMAYVKCFQIYFYVSPTIQLNISHLFTHSWMIKQFYFKQFSWAEVHSLIVKQFYLTHRYPVWCYHSGTRWTRECRL